MSPYPFEKLITMITLSSLSNSDKVFLINHTQNTLKIVGEECVNVPLKHLEELSQDIGKNTCGRARVRQCESIIEDTRTLLSNNEQIIEDILTKMMSDEQASNMTPQDVILLSESMYCNGICITFASEDVLKIEQFRFLCLNNIPSEMTPFHLVNHEHEQMFDIWYPNTIYLHELCEKFASDLNVPVTPLPGSVNKVVLSPKYTPKEYISFNDRVYECEEFYG